MNDIDNLFFELIRVAIGTQEMLSVAPSEEEWHQLYDMAKKQSIVGICFVGLQQMGGSVMQLKNNPLTENLSKKDYMRWMAMAAKIQQRNSKVNQRCVDLQRMLASDGYKSCVLKGQAVGSLYGPLAGLRQSGDIDTWMVSKPKEVIEWARKTGKMYYYDYHHADIDIFEETEVELHYRPSLSRNLIRNCRLQRWFKEEGAKHIVSDFDSNYNSNLNFNSEGKELCFSKPDYEFNVLLTMNHNFFHLMYEGVGFRQFMDLFFILKSCEDDKQREKAWHLMEYMQLKRFTRASMWIMKEVFGLEEKYLLCESDEAAGRFLLSEIMQAGNFGHHDNRLKENRYKTSRVGLMAVWMKHNLRLIKYYPADVLWTPIGILRISLWRRWHYRNEKELKNIKV